MKTEKSQQGFSLIEVLISTALIGLIAVAILLAVRTAIMASNQAGIRTTAESLITAQIEKIKSGGYIVADNSTGISDYSSTVVTLPTGFRFNTLERNGQKVHDSSDTTGTSYIYGIPWNVSGNAVWPIGSSPGDPGIQSITLVIESSAELNSSGNWKEIMRITDFKVNR